GGDTRGGQGTLDQQLDVVGPVDHVDIFIFQLPHNAVDTTAFHAHAGAHRIDPVVVRLDGHLGPFARLPHDLADHNQAVEYFGHLDLQQFSKKNRGSSR